MDKSDFLKIGKNSNYEVAVNKYKNYLLVSLYGLWDKTAQLEYFHEDILTATSKLSPDFNCIIDLTHYRGSTSERTELHLEVQKAVIKAGLNKTAVLMQDNPMLKITVDYLFQMSGVKATYFNNYSAAEKWLIC